MTIDKNTIEEILRQAEENHPDLAKTWEPLGKLHAKINTLKYGAGVTTPDTSAIEECYKEIDKIQPDYDALKKQYGRIFNSAHPEKITAQALAELEAMAESEALTRNKNHIISSEEFNDIKKWAIEEKKYIPESVFLNAKEALVNKKSTTRDVVGLFDKLHAVEGKSTEVSAPSIEFDNKIDISKAPSNETPAFSSINDLNGNAVVDPISDAIEHSAIGTNYNAYVAEDTATLVNKLAEQHQPSWRNKLTPAWLKSKSNANEIKALTQKIYESDASLHLLNDLAKVKEFTFSAAKTYPKQREILGKAMRAIHEGSPLSEDELNHLNGFLETPITPKSLKEMHATFITSTEAHHSKFREIVADHKLKYNIEASVKPFKNIDVVAPSKKLEPAIQDIKFNEAMEFSGGIKLNETVGFNGGVKLNEGLEFAKGIKTAKSSKEWKNPLNKAGDWVKSKQWWPSKEDWRGLWPFGKKNAPVTNQELSEIKAVGTNWISENKGKAALIGAGVIAAGGWVAHTMKSDKPEHRNR